MSECAFVEVAVGLPLHKTFTYRLPSASAPTVNIGMRVLVPFGKRTLTGYVTGFSETAPPGDIKEVQDIIAEEPLFSPLDLEFYRWVSQYYFYPLGQTISAALPQGIAASCQKTVSITEQGKEMLQAGRVPEQSLKLLKALGTGKAVSFKALEKLIGKQSFFRHIQSLRKKGMVELSIKKARGVRVKKEKWASISAPGLQDALKGKQRETYQFLQARGAAPVSAISKHCGAGSSTLTALLQKGAILITEQEVFRRPPAEEEAFIEQQHELTREQHEILQRIEKRVEEIIFYPFLLHGVTGSGKTEIYLRVMKRVVQQQRQCLLMVPEIALTAQLWDRVCSRINVPCTMLHSGLSQAERFDAWRMIRRGDIRIVIGARSAIFASFADLGAIIVDEEHDSSYKQEGTLRYSGRDLSLIKGKLSKAVVILGSATPSLESYYNAEKKKYHTGALTVRVNNHPLPVIKVIDMRIAPGVKRSVQSILSSVLQTAIQERIQQQQQCLLFLNRRGFAPVLLCQQCGYTFRCTNCDVSLIHHHRDHQLRCHYCDLAMPQPESCPRCQSFFLTPLGWGTERLEKEMQILFPRARIARMDRDTASVKGASRDLLKRLFRGDLDILIGTQMITKGHHLPRVTLVGVVCADHSLNFPDYRAGERTFQLLTQVAGRAGRGEIPGEVFIQTFNPDHYSIVCAQRHDYQRFYEAEMANRKELGYPPFKRMINVRMEGPNKERLISCAHTLGEKSAVLAAQLKLAGAVDILGPAPAPWGKIKGKYRYQMLLKSPSLTALRLLASHIFIYATTSLKGKGITFAIDVDPIFIL